MIEQTPEDAKALAAALSAAQEAEPDSDLVHPKDYVALIHERLAATEPSKYVTLDTGEPDIEAQERALREQVMLRNLDRSLAPRTEEQARARRVERDRTDAETLRSIVHRHHEGYVEGLTEEDIHTLTQVGFRLIARHDRYVAPLIDPPTEEST